MPGRDAHTHLVDQTVSWAAAEQGTHTTVIDTQRRTLHRLDDLVEAGLLAAILLLVLLLSIYTQRTTTAVTSDVTTVITWTLSQIWAVPVRIVENFVTLLVPVVVLGFLAWRAQWTLLLQAIATGLMATLIAKATTILLLFASASGPLAALFVAGVPHWSLPVVAISESLVGITALTRMGGERASHRHVRACWGAIWGVLVLLVIQGRMTLVSAIVTVLIGAIMGSLGRFAWGTPSRRASDAALIASLTTLGISATKVVRVDSPRSLASLSVREIRVINRPPSAVLREAQLHASITPLEGDGAAAIAEARALVGVTGESPDYARANRFYAVTDTSGATYRVEVTDSDRLLVARLTNWWSRLRLRGTEHSEAATIRDAVEHTALVSQAAESAGVRGPACVGVTRADESYVVVFRVASPLRPLADVPATHVSDDVLADLWNQLRACHARGLTHRNIDDRSVSLDSDNLVNLSHWDQGEVAASDLAQRVDLVQTLALTCLVVGEDRALTQARAALGEETLTSLLPMLQGLALPTATRGRAKAAKTLPSLRASLREIAQVESYDVPAVDLRGFSVKALMVTTVGVLALIVVFSTLNFADLTRILSTATWWWLLAGFGLSLLNAPAQTMIMKGVCPERLEWSSCTAVQLAGSLTALVAPTALGVAALNLRYLNKRGIPTARALATVSLLQLFQFVVTVLLLLVFVGFTGTSIQAYFFSGPLLWSVIALVAAVGLFFAITPTRSWALTRLAGPVSQVWPRVVWVMSSPGRVLYASAGVVAMVLTQVACFGCALLAFGHTLSFSTLAVTFLVSNTVGSLVPTPGGLGPIEAALTGGLQLAGIPSAVALSAALAYRLMTFWGRAPVGWLALTYLQRKGIL